MVMKRIPIWPAILFLLAIVCSRPANGDLVLGLVTPVEWDVAASPDGIFDVMFSVSSNGESNASNELNAFSVALRIVPLADSVGELIWESVRLPPNNSTFPSYDGSPVFSQSGDVVTFSVSNGQFENGVPRDVAVTSTPTNLLAAKFSSRLVGGVRSPISGRFLVYAVAFQTTYFTSKFEEHKFANVPDGADDPGIPLGEISVLGVPEPGAGFLCLLATSTVVLRGRRRPALQL